MTLHKRTTSASLVLFGAVLAAPALAHQEGLVFNPAPSTYRVPAPPELALQLKGLKAVQAAVQVTYLPSGSTSGNDTCTSWTPQAQAAFQYAADIWASQLQSTVPITVNACYATNLGGNVLGHASPTNFFSNFANRPVANTFYPIALANALSGQALDPSNPNIRASFNANFNWYYGTDGNTPISQVDFVSIVLHELGHGIGFVGTMNVAAGVGSWGFSSFPGRPPVFDTFTVDGAGHPLATFYTNPSAALAAPLLSAVYFTGTQANSANGGVRAPLYAPASWAAGSSYVHLAESFNNTPNALMTYSFSAGESIHSPGPVMLGILKDMGWQLQTASTADLSVTQTIGPNPAAAGKDATFTITASNAGPGTATGVSIALAYDPTATVIWASPACTAVAGVYTCNVGTMANGATIQFTIVLRKGAVGTLSNTTTITSATLDPNNANNSVTSAVSVNAGPVSIPVLRYRLYSPVSLEHHFTTDLNEYNVLGASGAWVQEGTVGKVLNNPGTFNGITAIPYYRLYNTITRWHHWTTDPNEYYTLGLFPGWNHEGVDGYVLPSSAAGTMQLYRLVYPNGSGLHHWTVDPAEYNALIATYGWVGEGGTGFVIQ